MVTGNRELLLLTSLHSLDIEPSEIMPTININSSQSQSSLFAPLSQGTSQLNPQTQSQAHRSQTSQDVAGAAREVNERKEKEDLHKLFRFNKNPLTSFS